MIQNISENWPDIKLAYKIFYWYDCVMHGFFLNGMQHALVV